MASSDTHETLVVTGFTTVDRKRRSMGPVRRDAAFDMSLSLDRTTSSPWNVELPDLIFDTDTDKHAAKVVVAWMEAQHKRVPISPISVADVEEKMGTIDLQKVLKIYKMLDIFAIRSGKADQLLRHWLLQACQSGIAAKQIEEVWDAFPLNKYPASAAQQRDLRPSLLETMNQVESKREGFYTEEFQLRELLGRRADFRAAWEATWKSSPAWWYRSGGAVAKQMLDSKKKDEPRMSKSTKIQWWLNNLKEEQ